MDLIQSLVRNLLVNLDLAVLLGAFFLMSQMVRLRATGEGLDGDGVSDLLFWVAVGALIGGRLGYALPSLESYLGHPADLIRINSGLYLYGAFAGGVVAGAVGARRRGLPFWSVADAYGVYAPLGIAVTRLSCLLWNTCYGARATPPLGIVFPGLTQPRYPSELYEGLIALLIFGSLMWLGERRHRPGTLFLMFLVAYPLARGAVDLTRINLGSSWGAADPIVSMSIAVLAAGVLWFRASLQTARSDRPA